MKLGKSIGILGKVIGIDSIISSIITIVLISGVVAGVFCSKNHYVWNNIIKESENTYQYTSYNKSYTSGVNPDVEDLYKNARVLYGYSDLENLSLENYSSESIMLYGWDKNNSEKLNNAISNILERVEILKSETSFNKKDKQVIVDSLKMVRYFCNNQQVIDKVRIQMKLIGETTKSDSSLNVTIINEGGREYFEGYEEKLNRLKDIFN